jgi:hypothetical protein
MYYLKNRLLLHPFIFLDFLVLKFCNEYGHADAGALMFQKECILQK